MRLYIGPLLGSTKLSRLDKERVEQFRDHLLRTFSRELAATVMVALRSLLRQAERPIDVRLERTPGRHRKRLEAGVDFPTPEQLRALLEAANGQARAILGLAALAGLRASEIRGLRWRDLDLPGGFVHVRQRADEYGAIGSPKSTESARTVPIGPELVRILKAWRLESRPGFELVFPSETGTPQDLSNLRLRVIGPVRLHALRHFYASWSLAEGVPLAVLRLRMGHSNIMMTANRYGHLLPMRSDERAELERAEAKLLLGG